MNTEDKKTFSQAYLSVFKIWITSIIVTPYVILISLGSNYNPFTWVNTEWFMLLMIIIMVTIVNIISGWSYLVDVYESVSKTYKQP